jgi:hypothetical protein
MESSPTEATHIKIAIRSIESGTMVDGCKNIKSSGCMDVWRDAGCIRICSWFGNYPHIHFKIGIA